MPKSLPTLPTLPTLWPLLFAWALLPSGASLFAHPPSPCVDGIAAIYPCEGIDLAHHLHLDQIGGGPSTKGSDIWGWTDSGSGREFALVALNDSTAFVEITDPSAPVYLGRLATASPEVDVWRDVKTYGHHAYIVADQVSGHGLQMFDLSQLLSVENPPVDFSETAHDDGFWRAHNMVINEATARGYAVGTNTCSAGLHMLDLSNPTSPSFLGCYGEDGYTHDAQCVVYAGPDLDHQGSELCFNANEDTLTIVDVSNSVSPQQISRTAYAGRGYTHQGWLTEDHTWFLLGDETDEQTFGHNSKTYIWDLSDLDAPTVHATYLASTPASDHNLYIRDGYAFEANYSSGLRILDLADIAQGVLQEVAYFDTFPANDAAGFDGAWSSYPFFASGTVIVSDTELGLFILTPTNLCREFAGVENLAAVSGGDHRIDLSWTDNAAPGESFRVYRAFGGCPGDEFKPIASGVLGGTYADTTASGGVDYAYEVRKVEEGGCESLASGCVSATTTGVCNAPPVFAGLEHVEDSGAAPCRLDLSWPAAQPNCGGGVLYSVYRADTDAFAPDPANRVAAGVDATAWSDPDALPGVSQYYIVRSQDSGNGVEDDNLITVEGTPTGSLADATWSTGAEVGEPGLVSVGNRRDVASKHAGWHLSQARAHTGSRSFFSQYTNSLCSGVKTPSLPLTAGAAAELSFWTVYDTEDDANGLAWDGGVVEISVNGAPWSRLDLLGGYPTTWRGNTNACGFAAASPCFGGRNLTWTRHRADLSPWAGHTVEIRWIFSTDVFVTEEGWYLDDIAVTHVQLPGSCTASTLFDDDFESGNLNRWSTAVP